MSKQIWAYGRFAVGSIAWLGLPAILISGILCFSTPPHARLHAGVGGDDQSRDSRGIAITSRNKLHMAHKLAATHQNAFRIRNLGTCKESDIHMSLKDIHVCKCRIGDACSRVAIVQALSDVVPAPTHGFKPIFRNFAQFAGMLPQPSIN